MEVYKILGIINIVLLTINYICGKYIKACSNDLEMMINRPVIIDLLYAITSLCLIFTIPANIICLIIYI